MKKIGTWILDNLPAIFIIAVFAFGVVMSAKQAQYKKDLQQMEQKINRI